MADSFEQWILSVMSGRTRGVGASLTRAALAGVEPAYAGVTKARNRLFTRGSLAVHRLPRPVISIGNLTTGGTGKTPATQWLVRALQDRGERPGILLRGYRRKAGSASDEEAMLRQSLGVPVVANADRLAGAQSMVAANPEVSVIILDDGFQHRRAARDVDVVLVDVTNPFGFGHVLPRGLLREPVAGIARAHPVILTRVDQADENAISTIRATIRKHSADVPIFHAAHRLTRLIEGERSAPIDGYRGRRVLAVSAIGNPAAYERSLADAGLAVVATRRFADHHAFVEPDIESLIEAARTSNADVIVTTEKDWVKLAALEAVGKSPVPFARVAMQFEFAPGEAVLALSAIVDRLRSGSVA